MIGDAKKLPEVPALSKMLGPSFILLGLGLGSGEIILWPYLSSKYGMGIIWAAILGITFQFFINMEIERYTIATGESIFVGFNKRFGRFTSYWFVLSSFIPWIWPGIAASSGAILGRIFGIEKSHIITIMILLLIGIIYSFGSLIYRTQEKLQKTIIFLGIPFIFALTVFLANKADYQSLTRGLIGLGEGYLFLPVGISLASFLGAMAYAGAGGNLNLAQSYYVKEKGYGLGRYSKKLLGIFSKKSEVVNLNGYQMEDNPDNITRFQKWWRLINLEHFIVFLLTGSLTIIMLSLLSYTTTKGKVLEEGLSFIFSEASYIGAYTFPVLSTIFLVFLSVMLFGTQFAVYGSTSRIISENIALTRTSTLTSRVYSKYFIISLWIQIALGILVLLFGFREPLTLVTIGAVLNGFSMFVYTGMLLRLNNTLLKQIRPNLFRISSLLLAFSFYGIFLSLLIFKTISN